MGSFAGTEFSLFPHFNQFTTKMRKEPENKPLRHFERCEPETNPSSTKKTQLVIPSTHSNSAAKSHDEEGSLGKVSKEGVGKLLHRAKCRRGRRECRPSDETNEKSPRENGELNEEHIPDFRLKGYVSGNVAKSSSNISRGVEGSVHCDANEMDREQGTISVSEFREDYSHEHGREVTVEFTDSPSSAQKKRSRRASAEEKAYDEEEEEERIGGEKEKQSSSSVPVVSAALLHCYQAAATELLCRLFTLTYPKDAHPSSQNNKDGTQSNSLEDDKLSRGTPGQNVQDNNSVLPSAHDHVHVFPTENQSFDEESMVCTKRCPCGFSIQVEEL